MKRMFSGLQRRTPQAAQQLEGSPSLPQDDSPESVIAREITEFCQASGGANNVAEDYLHLPAIVEAAESSANAAKDAVARIRKYLSSPAKAQGPAQYNAIMLIRILSENPGHTFTRNFDAKFVNTIKDLLREGRDMAAQAMLRETLDMFESQKPQDKDLSGLINMWKKEKQRSSKYTRPPQAQATYFQPSAFPAQPPRRQQQLPPPDELAARVSEAKTSGNLLIQLAQTTPAAEVPSNELMREFGERCSAAARSFQTYMAIENPPPDEDTLLTLIETNEHLSVALSKYQRAVLNARKAATTTTATNGSSNGMGNVNGRGMAQSTPSPIEEAREQHPAPPAPMERAIPPPGPPPGVASSPVSVEAAAAAAAAASLPSPLSPPPQSWAAANRYAYNPNEFRVENPFADHTDEAHGVSPVEERSKRV